MPGEVVGIVSGQNIHCEAPTVYCKPVEPACTSVLQVLESVVAESHFEGHRRISVVAVEGSDRVIALLLSQEEVPSTQAKPV